MRQRRDGLLIPTFHQDVDESCDLFDTKKYRKTTMVQYKKTLMDAK